MIRYIIRRLVASIPVLFGIIFVTFVIGRLVPGDPCRAILGDRASPASCAQFRTERGLDKPIPVQFALYMGKVVRGDLEESIKFNRPVTQIMIERMPLTTELALASLFIAVVVGIPLGILAAARRNSIIDVVTMIFANTGVSIPVFFLGLMLAYFFAITLKETPFALPPSGRLPAGMTPTPFYEKYNWTMDLGCATPDEDGTLELSEPCEDAGCEDLNQVCQVTVDEYLEATETADPAAGFAVGLTRGLKRAGANALTFLSRMYTLNAILTLDWELLKESVRYFILPSLALSTIPMSIIARMTRSSMLEVLGLDYIRTARAKGLRFVVVIFKHAMRNALLPVVTIIGLQLGGLLGGAVLTETIFNLTGVGRTLFEGITGRDYPVVQGFTLLIAFIFVFANLAVDVSYAYLDPRIKLD